VFDVCWDCGEWTPRKRVERTDPGRAVAVCPQCGREHAFRRRPLLCVAGASGAGKTSVLRELLGTDAAVPFEADVLWEEGLDPETFADRWLRVARDLHQSTGPALLFGAGLTPDNIGESDFARYFSAVEYLALVADDDALARRLRARPDWRGTAGDEFLADQRDFDRHLRELAAGSDRVTALDTTDAAPAETAARVESWVRAAADR
jgi:broad-specificity NMP kinase